MKTELALYQALISINVPEQKANAVIEALEADMLSRLATKADLHQMEIKLTLRMGLMLSVTAGIMLTAIKLML